MTTGADAAATDATPQNVSSRRDGGPRPRQAVVVLHGMGEQRAMDTLRSFVAVAVPKPSESRAWFYSRPDKVAEEGRYDQRRFLAPAEGARPQVELYEYPWAHLMSGNELRHLAPLAKRVMFRLPKNPRIGALWAFLWILAAAVGAGALLLGAETNQTLERIDIDGILAFVGATGVWGWVLTLVFKRVVGFAVGTLADFARYTDAAPENQQVRDEIRGGLIDLLTQIHDSTITTRDRLGRTVTYPRYDRIIVATHSLGSIIAYDALSLLWARFNKLHAPPDPARPFSHEKLVELERLACDLNLEDATSEQYQAAQREAWMEQRKNGNPWRITDFVSFGNPMAQAEQLLATNKQALRQKICRGEAASCPPQPDDASMKGPPVGTGTDDADWQWCRATAREQKEAHDDGEWHYFWMCSACAPILAHSSLFAVTRWTNVWYRADLFAGPLGSLFGHGIRDVKAAGDGLSSRIPVVAHTKYLSHTKEPLTARGSTRSLRDALGLEALPWLEGVPRLAVAPESARHTTAGPSDCP